jgi:oligopeptide transport system substrate-binding protein
MNSSHNCVLLLSLLALSACTQQDAISPANDASTVVFHRGNGGEPATLDPHRNDNDVGANLLRDLYEGLTTDDGLAGVVPGAAESWELSPDGLVYTFTLRDQALWSNGDAVVAEDFVAGFRRTVDPSIGSSSAQLLFPIRNAQAITEGRMPAEALGVKALDTYALEITLAAATPYFLGLLSTSSTYPIHRASLDEFGERFTRPGNLVSNGPYRLSEWVVQSHIRLDRNPGYWDTAQVQIDTVYHHATENADAELRRYRAGELDYTYQIPDTQYQWIVDNLPGELRTAPYISVYYFGFDMSEPPFDDVRLRQALSMAISRNTITEQVLGLGQLPAYSFVPPGVNDYSGYRYPWANLNDAQRVSEARRLYREAGYSVETPLQVRIHYNTDENHRRVALAVASMWKEVLGIDAQPFNEEFRVLLQTRFSPADWEVLRLSWFGDYNDAYSFLEVFLSDSGQNFMGFSSEAYDDLADAAAMETNPDIRSQLMLEAEETMLADYPLIPTYFYVSKHLVKPYVTGFQSNIMNRHHTRHFHIERN